MSPSDHHPRRALLPWLRWRYSVILVAGLVLLVASWAVNGSLASDVVTLTVRNADDQPIPGALVQVDDDQFVTDAEGMVRFAYPTAPVPVSVSADGYVSMVATFDDDIDAHQMVELQPRSSGSPPVQEPSPETGASTNEPLRMGDVDWFRANRLASIAGNGTGASISSGMIPIEGLVTDQYGKALQGAWVTDGREYVFTGPNGAFSLTAPATATLKIFCSGYAESSVRLDHVSGDVDVSLRPEDIKGIYVNPLVIDTQPEIQAIIDIANTTEVNAVVIDIKEYNVFFDTDIDLFTSSGNVTPIMDLPTLLKRFHDNGIYTIARLVVFKDPSVAIAHPELAVRDAWTGGLWVDNAGVAWVNPNRRELWNANIDLAVEAAEGGFDEIQYDYIRFPTDGNLTRADFGAPNTEAMREAAIEGFLKESQRRLSPLGIRTSADVFGYTTIVTDDLGIGQNLDHLVNYVDYLSPMVYPSHWPTGSIAVGGVPNDFPYETVSISMNSAESQLGRGNQLRPWLQDFTLSNMRAYGPADVRAQINAAEDAGTSGWLIWSPYSWFDTGALSPQSTMPKVLPDVDTRWRSA